MHDVISAFLDNEPFDAQELSASLATPEGRELLIDLIALRSVVQPVEGARALRGGYRPLWMLASAAAVLLALASGYQFGRTAEGRATPAPDAAGWLVISDEDGCRGHLIGPCEKRVKLMERA